MVNVSKAILTLGDETLKCDVGYLSLKSFFISYVFPMIITVTLLCNHYKVHSAGTS